MQEKAFDKIQHLKYYKNSATKMSREKYTNTVVTYDS